MTVTEEKKQLYDKFMAEMCNELKMTVNQITEILKNNDIKKFNPTRVPEMRAILRGHVAICRKDVEARIRRKIAANIRQADPCPICADHLLMAIYNMQFVGAHITDWFELELGEKKHDRYWPWICSVGGLKHHLKFREKRLKERLNDQEQKATPQTRLAARIAALWSEPEQE